MSFDDKSYEIVNLDEIKSTPTDLFIEAVGKLGKIYVYDVIDVNKRVKADVGQGSGKQFISVDLGDEILEKVGYTVFSRALVENNLDRKKDVKCRKSCRASFDSIFKGKLGTQYNEVRKSYKKAEKAEATPEATPEA